MKSEKEKNTPIHDTMDFNKALFWDVEYSSLDLQTHCRFIIERVVSRGNRSDWEHLKKIYGKEKIKEEVVHLRYLDPKTLSFLSAYFQIAKKDFRCSENKDPGLRS